MAWANTVNKWTIATCNWTEWQKRWKISLLNPNNIKYNKIITYKLISDKFRADKCLNLKLTRFINDIYFIIIQMEIEVSAKVHTAHIYQRIHTHAFRRENVLYFAQSNLKCAHIVLCSSVKPRQATPSQAVNWLRSKTIFSNWIMDGFNYNTLVNFQVPFNL